jgi:hypothetical protein
VQRGDAPDLQRARTEDPRTLVLGQVRRGHAVLIRLARCLCAARYSGDWRLGGAVRAVGLAFATFAALGTFGVLSAFSALGILFEEVEVIVLESGMKRVVVGLQACPEHRES